MLAWGLLVSRATVSKDPGTVCAVLVDQFSITQSAKADTAKARELLEFRTVPCK